MTGILPALGYTPPGIKEVTLDKDAMSATGVFATTSLDRVGDVLEVSGIVTDYHRRNPICLWNHGQQLSIPIGKCEDPAGNYTVVIDAEAGEARCTTYFSQHLLEAEKIYRLIEEGVIRAMSIGYRPLQAKRMKADPNALQKPGLYLEKVELLEASFVAVPANQDCVRAALSRDKVCGKSLAPAIRRALLPLLGKSTSVTVPLLTRKGGTLMSKTSVKTDPAEEVNTPAKNDPAAAPPDAPKTDEVSPEEVAGQKDDLPQLPLGAEILTMVHQHLIGVVDYCNTEMPRLENERLSAYLVDLCEETFEKLATIEEMYKAEYPDLDPLPEVGAKADEVEEKPAEGEDKPADEPAEKSDEEKPKEEKPKEEAEAKGSTSKSYPGAGKRFTKAAGNTIRECAEHLTEMEQAENLTKNQKLVCRHYSKALGELAAEPEPAKSEDEGNSLTPEQKRLVEAKIKRLELLVAHKRRLARQKALKGR